MPARKAIVRAWVVGAAAVLSGCGGGLFIGVDDRFDDSPPSVNLATAANSVVAGQAVQFVAAASDENGVDPVSFYRLDTNGSVLLGRDFSAPYEWSVVAPTDGRSK